MNFCACGCGVLVAKRFKVGHHKKLLSQQLFAADGLTRFQRYERKHYRRDATRRPWRYTGRSTTGVKVPIEECRRKWLEKHPLAKREYSSRRRILKKRPASVLDYDAIWAGSAKVCYLCEKPIETQREAEFDHVVPISAGGEHVESNIRLTHMRCNRSKGQKLVVNG